VITFDEERVRREIESLEGEKLTPGFWAARDRAKEVSQRLERDRSALSRYHALREELEEVEVLYPMVEEAQDETERGALAERISALEQKARDLRIEFYFSGPYDLGDSYLSINAGAGGTDSQDWAAMLLRMYGRFCERAGFKTTLLEASPGETAGIRSATLEIKGRYTYGYLKGERGVHRLVRMSPFDAAHRRHTSFCAVSVVPITEEQALEIDPRDLRIDTYRSTGAGGQGVNTTDSAVRITHRPTGLVVSCQNERSQHQNKETAMKVLRARLGELLRRQEAKRIEELRGEMKDIEWGSQIRSYVLQPYQMVKDHRTDVETGNVNAVLDGDLMPFLEAYLEANEEGARSQRGKA
jgi:peptide chain release factor 2